MTHLLTSADLRKLRNLARRLEARGLAHESRTLFEIVRGSRVQREMRASVAAEILHVSPQTIRNWIKSGLLEGRSDRTGHFFVSTEALELSRALDTALPYAPPELADVSDHEINAEIKGHRSNHRVTAR